MLLVNAQSTLERLRQVETAREGLEEARSLDVLKIELSALASRFHALVNRGNLFISYKIPVTQTPNVQTAKHALLNVESRFKESSTASTLKQGTRWTGFIDKLREMINALENQQNLDWKAYFLTHLFAGVRPDERRTTLVQIPENKKAIDRYTELYQRFTKFRARVPVSLEEFKDVHYCSDELMTITFVEDVPYAVKQFFNAVASGSGANLELLTSEVTDWLRENKLLGSYVVRARS